MQATAIPCVTASATPSPTAAAGAASATAPADDGHMLDVPPVSADDAGKVDLTDTLAVARFMQRVVLVGSYREARKRAGRGNCNLPEALAALEHKTFDNDDFLGRLQSRAKAIGERDPRALVETYARDGRSTFGFEHSLRAFELLTGTRVKASASASVRAKAIYDWAGWSQAQIDEHRADIAHRAELSRQAREAREREEAKEREAEHAEWMKKKAEQQQEALRAERERAANPEPHERAEIAQLERFGPGMWRACEQAVDRGLTYTDDVHAFVVAELGAGVPRAVVLERMTATTDGRLSPDNPLSAKRREAGALLQAREQEQPAPSDVAHCVVIHVEGQGFIACAADAADGSHVYVRWSDGGPRTSEAEAVETVMGQRLSMAIYTCTRQVRARRQRLDDLKAIAEHGVAVGQKWHDLRVGSDRYSTAVVEIVDAGFSGKVTLLARKRGSPHAWRVQIGARGLVECSDGRREPSAKAASACDGQAALAL